MSQTKDSRGFRLVPKPIVSVAVYETGAHQLLTAHDKTDPNRVLLY